MGNKLWREKEHAVEGIVPSIPQIHMLKLLAPQCEWYLEMDLWEVILFRLWWWGPHDRISAIWERHQRTCSCTLSAIWGHSEKVAVCKPGKELSLETNHLVPRLWTQSLQNCEKNVCCLKPYILWYFLWWLELTNIEQIYNNTLRKEMWRFTSVRDIYKKFYSGKVRFFSL